MTRPTIHIFVDNIRGNEASPRADEREHRARPGITILLWQDCQKRTRYLATVWLSIIVFGAVIARAQQAPAGLVAAFADRAQEAEPALGAPYPDFLLPRRQISSTSQDYWVQPFANGMITYSPRTGLQVVSGAIFRTWMRFSTEAGLGLPTSGESISRLRNRFQLFEKGLIYEDAASGTTVVALNRDEAPALPPGARALAVSVPIDPRIAITQRGVRAGLGIPRPESLFPIRTPLPRNTGFWQAFSDGWVYAREGDFPYIVRMPIFGEWAQTGWEQGPLGFPVSDARTLAARPPIIAPPGAPRGTWPEEQFPNDRVQFFERGAIYLHSSAKGNSTELLIPDATGGTREMLTKFKSVSPNVAFGVRSGAGGDPGGKFVAVVADRFNVWAAAEKSGVWRSLDGGHSWRQASVGLTSGLSRAWETPLAVSESGKLLYATEDDDFWSSPRGGLFKSLNAGDSWERVMLPCPRHDAHAVAFSRRNALAVTGCGLFRNDTNDSPNMTAWQPWSTPARFTKIAASPTANSIVGCAGSSVYLSTDEGAMWMEPLNVAGTCTDISFPATRGGRKAVVLYNKSVPPGNLEIATLDFTSRSVVVHNFDRPFITDAGRSFVRAIARSDSETFESLDIFAGNGFEFFVSARGSGWEPIEGVHPDTWGVAIKPGYSPELGRCGVYLANDGGIYANASSAGGPCITRVGPWVMAQHGLHALNVFSSAGARLPASVVVVNRDGSIAPPPTAFYISTAHNGSWAYADGFSGAASWRPPEPGSTSSFTGGQLAELGDAGGVYLDPALPNFVAFSRGDTYRAFRNNVGRTPANSSSPRYEMSPPENRWIDPAGPPYQASLSQVLTPPGLSPSAGSDFFAIFLSATPPSNASLERGADPSGVDDIARKLNLGEWRSVGATPAQLLCTPINFGCRFVQIQAVRRRDDTVIYLLGTDGQLRQLTVNSSNRITFSTIVSRNLIVLNFVANPYDLSEIYVSDSRSSSIMVTRNAGDTWTPDNFLTQLATNNGEFRFLNCCTDVNSRSLQSVIFSREALNVRVALLSPSNAIAYSNSSGRNWTVLSRHAFGEGDLYFLRTPKDLLALNMSGFFMPYYRGGGVLYVAYHGRSLMRIDAPFEYLP